MLEFEAVEIRISIFLGKFMWCAGVVTRRSWTCEDGGQPGRRWTCRFVDGEGIEGCMRFGFAEGIIVWS